MPCAGMVAAGSACGSGLVVPVERRVQALQIAGGIVLSLFGLQIIFGAANRYVSERTERGHSIAVFPLAILAVTYFMMLWSDRIYSVLGDSGTAIAARIMGLVLAALAVEMVIEGIRLAFDIQ